MLSPRSTLKRRLELLKAAQSFNTLVDQLGVPSVSMNLTITFATPLRLDQSLAPYDLFLARSDNYAYQFHMPQYAGTDQMDKSLFHKFDDRSVTGGTHFINERGLPFVTAAPDSIAWPRERVSIERAYPHILDFGSSAGLTGNGWCKDGSTVTALIFANGSNGVGAVPPRPPPG
jgi:LruC domain-containing protein